MTSINLIFLIIIIKKCSNNVTKKEEIIGWEMKILKMMKIA